MRFPKVSLYPVTFWFGLLFNAFSLTVNVIIAAWNEVHGRSPVFPLGMACAGAIAMWVLALLNVKHAQHTAGHLKHMEDLEIQMAMHKEMFERIKQTGEMMLMAEATDSDTPRH